MKTKALLVKIRGRVTGVGFRWATLDKASEFKSISGYVRNSASGEVEVFLQGDENEIDKMLAWLHTGPPFARVDSVEIQNAEQNDSIKDFRISP